MAHFSKDPTFLDAYRRNIDIHSLTASTIYGVAEKDVTREMRDRAKEVNFGLIYRMGAERLSIVTKTPKRRQKNLLNAILRNTVLFTHCRSASWNRHARKVFQRHYSEEDATCRT